MYAIACLFTFHFQLKSIKSEKLFISALSTSLNCFTNIFAFLFNPVCHKNFIFIFKAVFCVDPEVTPLKVKECWRVSIICRLSIIVYVDLVQHRFKQVYWHSILPFIIFFPSRLPLFYIVTRTWILAIYS